MRQRSRIGTLVTLASGALLLGCQALPIPPMAQGPAKVSAREVFPRLQGQVSFPGERQVAATTGDVVSRATVSIIDAAGQTVAATVTDAAGAFSLDVTGSFTPAAGAYYTVEAIKGLSSSTSASNAVRMRTILQWTGTAWNSCTGGATITINPTTTAVSLIKAKLSAVGFAETMGVVSGSTVTSGNATLNANWQAVRDLVSDLLWRDLDPVARIGLNGTTFSVVSDRAVVVSPDLNNGTFSSTWLMLDGSVQLSGGLPRPKTGSEFSYSTGLSVSGLVACDGVYLHVRPWGGSGVAFSKVGTGFGGTTAGLNSGAYGSIPADTLSAAFIGGQIYMGQGGGSTTVERINVSTGALSTVTVGAPVLRRNSGLSDVGDWSTLFTDGTYLYSGSYRINSLGAQETAPTTPYNGHVMRVYDPALSFAMVRQIQLDGSNTPLAGTSYYTDSFFSDGVYVFAMEWNPNTPARMRRYRLADGQLEAETTFAQLYNAGAQTDDPIYGTYDVVNNKFWFGDYTTGTVHRTAGRVFPSSGTWTSQPMDMGSAAPLYGRLNFNTVAVNGQTVRFQMRSATDRSGLNSATWYGPTGAGDYYTASGTAANPVHNRHRWIQIRATLAPDTSTMLTNSGPLVGGGTGPSASANTTPRLYGVSLEATP